MRKKPGVIIPAVITIIILVVGFFSCSDSESRMSPLLKQATVILDIGLPPQNPSASNNSIWDRLRRFFVPDAIAQTAPASFGSIAVRVTGADFGAMEQTFGGTDAVSLSVPSGSLRQFEVTASTAPGDPSAALTFRGTATADLPAGGTVSVPVVMGLNETKFVVPDNNNDRIVVLNSITGSYASKYGTDLGLGSDIAPYDLDFDSRGRMYIADQYSYPYSIIRVDSLNGGNPIHFYLVGESYPIAVAVDRINNIVYYADNSQLYRGTIDGSSTSSLSMDTINSINGMDVGSDGMIYIAGIDTNQSDGIFKYDPAGQKVIGQYLSDGTNIFSITDVQVKFPFIFALNPFGANSDYYLLQFQIGQNNTIDLIGHGTNPGIGSLTNAGHFTAIINSGLLIMENNLQVQQPDRLIFIQDVNGTGWQVNSGNGTDGPFGFADYVGVEAPPGVN